MRQVVTLLIVFYQRFISALLPPRCRYYPSCSQYTLEAVDRFGGFRGLWLGLKRICRCHPFAASGYDPVPEQWGSAASVSDSSAELCVAGESDFSNVLATNPGVSETETTDNGNKGCGHSRSHAQESYKFFGIENCRSEHIYTDCDYSVSEHFSRRTHISMTTENRDWSLRQVTKRQAKSVISTSNSNKNDGKRV